MSNRELYIVCALICVCAFVSLTVAYWVIGGLSGHGLVGGVVGTLVGFPCTVLVLRWLNRRLQISHQQQDDKDDRKLGK